MSPVLLDHSNLKWIWLSVGLLSFLIFFIGYIAGFEKSNNKWMSKLDPVEISIPNSENLAVAAAAEPVSLSVEPGENIDVDSVEEGEFDPFSIVNNADAHTIGSTVPSATLELEPSNSAAQESLNINTIRDTKTTLLNVVSNLDSLVLNEQIVAPSAKEVFDELPDMTSIVEDADEKTAKFSIQVGMYSSFDNATSKAAELLNRDLNAYLDEYKNKNNETRYRVRFGYFSSFKSAGMALDVYVKSFAGSGYVASIDR